MMISRPSTSNQSGVASFWQTTCGPCRKEISVLNWIDAHPEAKVLAINLEEELAVVRSFVEANHADYSVLLGDGDLFRKYEGFSIPYTVIVGPDRKIARIYRGQMTEASLVRDFAAIQTGNAG